MKDPKLKEHQTMKALDFQGPKPQMRRGPDQEKRRPVLDDSSNHNSSL